MVDYPEVMNKKIVFAFTVAVIISASACAQFSYGVKAGLNVSRMTYETIGDSISTFGFLPSFHVGMYGALDFSDKFNINADFLFSDKGFKENSAGHLLYACLPVMLNYKPFKNFSIGLGPSLGILIGSWGKERDAIKEIYNNPIDVGAVAGVQYSITSSIALSLRFEQGLSNVLGRNANVQYYGSVDGDPIIYTPNLRDMGFKFHNQSFQLSVCYSLMTD